MRSSTARRWIGIVAALLASCERATVTTSAIQEHPAPHEELEFFESLESKSVVSNDDALHALFLITDVEDHWGSYGARVTEAKRRDWLPRDFDEPANESAQVGWVARIACMAAGVRGGFTMMILGPVPRYAVRELANAQILVGKRENQGLTGSEFVDFLTRLDRMTQLRKQTAQLSVPAGGGSGQGSSASQESSPRLQPPSGRFE
ncbi:MAG: hypothetical protein EXS03_04565 [Phycisphaerales bacterium]|nr:hypothetical protein [Phycisphaerales bacterium]